jgi:hypothetical protein
MGIIRINILCVIFIFSFASVFSQTLHDTIKKNSLNEVFIEAGGNAFYVSFNYERIFFNKGMHQLGARIGASPNGMPVLIDYFLGRNHNYLEIGAGTLITEKLKGTMRLMYRYKFTKGYYASIGFTPMIFRLQPHFNYEPWAAIDIGYRF